MHNLQLVLGKVMFDFGAPRSRKVVRRSTHRVVGRFPSFKCSRVMHWESQLERDMIALLEFAPDVEAYAEQPEPMHYTLDGRVRRYTPDFIVLNSGAPIVIEVKPYRILSDESWKRLFALANEHYGRWGAEFRIYTELEIRVEPRLGNVKALLRYQREHVPTAVIEAALNIIGSQEIKFAELERTLARDRAKPEIHSMICNGFLSIDHDLPLSGESIVRPGQSEGGFPWAL